VDIVFALLGLPREDGLLTAQITLSHSHVGLGLFHNSPTNGAAAYLTSAATAHRAVHSGPKAFRPFNGPSGDLLRLQWETLQEVGGPLWTPEFCEVGPDCMGTIADTQSEISWLSAQIRADALTPVTATWTRESAPARAFSCACLPGSAWVVALSIL
jgi:hypothetical protein